jgi:hypothetical protein
MVISVALRRLCGSERCWDGGEVRVAKLTVVRGVKREESRLPFNTDRKG